jgi:thioesterase domain-containing protein
MRLIANLRDKTGVTLPLRKLFEIPTVEGISRVLSDFDPIYAFQPLLPLKHGTGQKSIFCLPAAGGNSITYRQFANLLSTDCSVWGLQAKGSEPHEEPHQSIEEMADAYAEAIMSLDVLGPIVLIGWSFGGNVCHALAQRLEELGCPIECVVILDSQAKFVGEAPPDKDLHQFLRETAKDFGVEFSEDENQTFSRFVDRFVSQGLIPPGTPPSWAKRVLSLMIMSEKLRHRYQPRAIRAPIALFVPEDGSEEKRIQSAQSWSDLTLAEVTLHAVPGSHMTMLDSPSVEQIVQTLSAVALEPEQRH